MISRRRGVEVAAVRAVQILCCHVLRDSGVLQQLRIDGADTGFLHGGVHLENGFIECLDLFGMRRARIEVDMVVAAVNPAFVINHDVEISAVLTLRVGREVMRGIAAVLRIGIMDMIGDVLECLLQLLLCA